MHRLLTGYVVNFNKRHRRHGCLFQNRFKSIVCQEDRHDSISLPTRTILR
jgi:hypothetical protein